MKSAKSAWHVAADYLHGNIKTVLELLNFDQDIIDVAAGALRSVQRDLESRGLHSAVPTLANRTRMLEQLATNESLRPRYATMFNQCVVLLVSYFGSGLHTIFRVSVAEGLKSGLELPVAIEELKISWRTLATAPGERESTFGDLLVAQKGYSFQDMKSTRKAFNDFLLVDVGRGAESENIILGQAARHAIVHAGAVVDDHMLKQLSDVKRRTLKAQLSIGDPIRFSTDEVRELAASMVSFVSALTVRLDETLVRPVAATDADDSTVIDEPPSPS